MILTVIMGVCLVALISVVVGVILSASNLGEHISFTSLKAHLHQIFSVVREVCRLVVDAPENM